MQDFYFHFDNPDVWKSKNVSKAFTQQWLWVACCPAYPQLTFGKNRTLDFDLHFRRAANLFHIYTESNEDFFYNLQHLLNILLIM